MPCLSLLKRLHNFQSAAFATTGVVGASSAFSQCDRLNTGAQVPLVGLGTYAKDSPEDYKAETVFNAIKLGFRHLDTAEAYFTEEAVGNGIHAAIQAGLVQRTELFITCKLWNHHHRKDDVKPSLAESLRKLKIDYADGFLVHWPVTTSPGPGLDPPYQETWEAMEDLLATGLTKAIGVSNLSIKKLTEVLSYAKIIPAIHQIEMHPLWRNDDLLAFNKRHGIHTTAWAPLGGQLSEPARLLERPEILGVARRVSRSPAQVVLRWALQRGAVSVIPKSDELWQMQANLALDFDLSDEDMAAVGGLQDQCRQHDSVEPMDPMFRPFFQPEGPWLSRAELWDDPVTYASLPPGTP